MKGEYFEWLYDTVCEQRYSRVSFRKLLEKLHGIEFTWIIPRDENRAGDGIALRYHYGCEYDGPCSVLEMMVALSNRTEAIMDDPKFGDRTGQWFWGMITNLGLGSMTDDRYNDQYVENTIEKFLNREYEYDGKGGLFTVKDPDKDLRDVEIWYQLCWYLNTIT